VFLRIVERMIFYPEKEFLVHPGYFGLTYEDVYLDTSDGIRIHGWFFPSSGSQTLLFFHGNAGNIADRLDNIRFLVQRGLNVLIIDYRGYGRSDGVPSEQGTYRDAESAWLWLQSRIGIDPARLVYFGRSLGGAVATELAVRHPPRKLIIESTFTSVREMAGTVLPFIPKMLIPDCYPSIKRIALVDCPILVIHGTADTLVPFRHGQAIYARARDPKQFYGIEGADHNESYLIGGENYFDILLTFIEGN
jgi:uncharacterized protein